MILLIYTRQQMSIIMHTCLVHIICLCVVRKLLSISLVLTDWGRDCLQPPRRTPGALAPLNAHVDHRFVEKLHALKNAEGLHLGNKLRSAHMLWYKKRINVKLAALTRTVAQ